MTNGDRIREMDDDDLAEYLCAILEENGCDINRPGFHMCRPGHIGLVDWLEAECEEVSV